MVSSRAEAEWDDEQRDLVIAEHIVSQLTGANGEWLPEATSDAADPNKFDAPTLIRYAASEEKTNWAEKMRRDKLAKIEKDKGEDANMNGVYVTVERREYPNPNAGNPSA